jgi:hypothetical protein
VYRRRLLSLPPYYRRFCIGIPLRNVLQPCYVPYSSPGFPSPESIILNGRPFAAPQPVSFH